MDQAVKILGKHLSDMMKNIFIIMFNLTFTSIESRNMPKQHFLPLLIIALISSLVASRPAHAANYVVEDSNLEGWQFIIDGTVPYQFTDQYAATGLGSLQFGPIDGGNPINKFAIRAPYLNALASDFTLFSYDIFVHPMSARGSQYFYINVFVDSAANGVGTLAGTFDCRYDFATPAGLPVGVWDTRQFDASFTGWVSMGQPMGAGTCQTSINALPAGSRIMYININGGGSTAADAGFMGGIDNVVIASGGVIDVYDFELAAVVIGPGGTIITISRPRPLDNRINNLDGGSPIAAYNLAFETGQGLIIYEIDANSRGFEVLVVTPEEIAAINSLPASNTLIVETQTARLQISFWRLSSGEFQINVLQPDGKLYVLIFNALMSGGGGYDSYEYQPQ